MWTYKMLSALWFRVPQVELIFDDVVDDLRVDRVADDHREDGDAGQPDEDPDAGKHPDHGAGDNHGTTWLIKNVEILTSAACLSKGFLAVAPALPRGEWELFQSLL